MKLIILVFAITIITKINAQDPSDAAKHIGAGIVIGVAGGYAAHKITNGQRGWKWAGAVGSSLAAGLAKETLYDKPKGYEWETKDVLYTTLGGILSGMALDILTSNTRRRNGGGKNCGCLVINLDTENKLDLPLFVDNGTGDINSELQAAYLLR
ncbi:hypothetical protein [Maribacter stanieri]|uniref:Glycine zipper 2TM domain-containing protein n=1 Tax=Maribacter stanieri TaxID=440514 RepID=A0A1I6KIW4_9FLAO|nr:hypothetical protein [Maribacter stanieri]SFR91175.1 hypothetical protein SAMN04488010_3722 [Maribacter stanieri]|tara:strand:+ start:141 stop:602 length:462 start_codon:yes stop_codon:yes gene_type:complete